MITTITLASVGCIMIAAALVVWMSRGQDMVLWRLLWFVADSLAIVVGGMIVRSSSRGTEARISN